MPIVRIDTIAGQYGARQRAAMSDVLYEAVRGIGALEHDRFQIFTEHAAEDLVFDRGYLGIRRSDGFVAIQITMNAGRSLAQKQGLFAAIADGFQAQIGIRREDVFVSLIEVAKENWSFGNGIAQYAPEA
jgi:phenylpyruvate tautomerase PptA (4-oxalocrotonate tautomerase family)